ncbi:MAG: QueT transporter family protein [Clostridiales bacterium]|nr:QueT transporter family protein [Clostridiales bacterium]
MKNRKTQFIVYAAVLAALYVVLTYAQNILLPGTTSMAIQFRISEALCIFAFFTPAAIPGLTIGCLLFNVSNASALPIDWLVGTVATLLATVCMYLLRNVKIKKIPVLGLLMPAVFNAPIVGAELVFYLSDAFTVSVFALNALYVFIGEAAVLLVVGTALYAVMIKNNLYKRIFVNSNN